MEPAPSHLAGAVRDVDYLKGANMSFRVKAVAGARFSTLLRGHGAGPHEDMAFSIAVRRRGWRLRHVGAWHRLRRCSAVRGAVVVGVAHRAAARVGACRLATEILTLLPSGRMAAQPQPGKLPPLRRIEEVAVAWSAMTLGGGQ